MEGTPRIFENPAVIPNAVPFGSLGALQSHRKRLTQPAPEPIVKQARDLAPEPSRKPERPQPSVFENSYAVPDSVEFGSLGVLQSHREKLKPPDPEPVTPSNLDVGAERSLEAIVDRGNAIQKAEGAVEAANIEVRTDLPMEGQVISNLTKLDDKGLGHNFDASA